MAGAGSSVFAYHDRALASLRGRHPGWQIWYVPHACDGSVTWCAQRRPILNEDSPERLADAITEAERAHTRSGTGSPPSHRRD
jgi:hypothetical protein